LYDTVISIFLQVSKAPPVFSGVLPPSDFLLLPLYETKTARAALRLGLQSPHELIHFPASRSCQAAPVYTRVKTPVQAA